MTKIELGQISGIGRSLFVICLLAGAALFGTPAPVSARVWPWLRRCAVTAWALVGIALAAALPLIGWFLDGKLYPIAWVSAAAALLEPLSKR